MKRAKFALTAVAVLAVIGGALAFKANSVRTFYSATALTAPCNQPIDLQYTTTVGGPGAFTTLLSIAPDQVNTCKVITVKLGA